MTTSTSLRALEGEPHANVFPDGEPKTIRLTLDEGKSVPAHQHPDRDIVFYLIEGAVDLQVGDNALSLASGDIARFAGDQDISPSATEQTVALIVLAPQDGD